MFCLQHYAWLESCDQDGSFDTKILGSLIVSPVLWVLSSRNTLSVTHSDTASKWHEKGDLFGGPHSHLQKCFCGKSKTECTGVLFCPLGWLAVHWADWLSTGLTGCPLGWLAVHWADWLSTGLSTVLSTRLTGCPLGWLAVHWTHWTHVWLLTT